MPIRFLTAGESHGPMLTAILEGMPAGLPLSNTDIDIDMARRQVGSPQGRLERLLEAGCPAERERRFRPQLRPLAGDAAGPGAGRDFRLLPVLARSNAAGRAAGQAISAPPAAAGLLARG